MAGPLIRRPEPGIQFATAEEQREYTNTTNFEYTDAELATLVAGEMRRTSADYNTQINGQREMSYRYYYGQPFGNERRGFSRHVSMEVFDAVQGQLAKLMNTFTSDDQICFFPVLDEDDVIHSQIATRYVNAIFSQHNPGYKNLHDIFFDGLVAKLATIKRYWKEETIVEPHRVDKVPYEVFTQFMARDDLELIEIGEDTYETSMQMTPAGPVQNTVRVISATIKQKRDASRIAVEVIPPEDVFISSWADDPNNADFVGVRYEKTKGQLIAEGFDAELVDKMSFDSGIDQWGADIVRHSVDSSFRDQGDYGNGEREVVTPTEAFVKIDMDGDGLPEIWKITCDNKTVLDKEMVGEVPFNFWSPYEIAHKAVGMSTADITTDLQRTSSGVVRGAIDNIFLTNTSSKAADMSTIRNPRDLIENPIGAIIDTANPQGIVPIMQPQLNAQTFNLYEILKQQKEERTGSSRLSQGMNGNVINHQNAADMIDALMMRGDDRGAFMARSFAERCFKPLLLAIYRLGVEYKQAVPLAVEGKVENVDPSQFKQREDMDIAVALTPEEREAQAKNLAMFGQLVGQDEEMAPLYGRDQKYAIYKDMQRLLGLNSPAYLQDPQDPEVQQQIQQQEAKMAEERAKQESAMMAQAQIAAAREATRAHEAKGKLALGQEKLALDATTKGDAQALDEDEFTWKQIIDKAEYQLEKTQKRPVAL